MLQPPQIFYASEVPKESAHEFAYQLRLQSTDVHPLMQGEILHADNCSFIYFFQNQLHMLGI